MKKIIKGLSTACVAMAVAGMVQAADMHKPQNTVDDYAINAADLSASPELKEQTLATVNATSMKCMVDTPKWDNWGSPNCFSSGAARYATAYFQIDNAPSNRTVYWSDSRCSSTAVSCSLPIRTYQSITLAATVLDNSAGTFVKVSSTAHYEGLD